MQRLSLLFLAALLVAVNAATNSPSTSWSVSTTGSVSISVSWSVSTTVSTTVSTSVSVSVSGSTTPSISPTATALPTPSVTVSQSLARAGICGDSTIQHNVNKDFDEDCDTGSLNAVFNSAGACCSTGCKWRDGNVRCAPASSNPCKRVPRCNGRGACRTDENETDNTQCTITKKNDGFCRSGTCVKKTTVSKKKRTTGRRKRTTGRRRN